MWPTQISDAAFRAAVVPTEARNERRLVCACRCTRREPERYAAAPAALQGCGSGGTYPRPASAKRRGSAPQALRLLIPSSAAAGHLRMGYPRSHRPEARSAAGAAPPGCRPPSPAAAPPRAGAKCSTTRDSVRKTVPIPHTSRGRSEPGSGGHPTKEGTAAFLQPVGVNQAQPIVLRRSRNGPQESLFVRHRSPCRTSGSIGTGREASLPAVTAPLRDGSTDIKFSSNGGASQIG
jgi:hypothetical protein